jgi:hypothetical protein
MATCKPPFVASNNMPNRIDRGFGRAVEIGDLSDLEAARNLALKLRR